MATEQLSPKVGVVGLGLMGTAITERLLAAGFVPVVWNRTRDKAAPLVARGAEWGDDPLAACDRVIISLFSSDVVREVLEQRLDSIRPGQILIDTTTGDPASSQAWERRLAATGGSYLDAPISGSSQQTRRGEATVIASGDRAAFDACRDLWPVLGQHVFHVGQCGSAAKMKLVSNLVLGLNRAALAEGLALAESLGLDLPMALEVLQQSAAYSRQMDTKGTENDRSRFRAPGSTVAASERCAADPRRGRAAGPVALSVGRSSRSARAGRVAGPGGPRQ
jgi:3-hydroxyisobutyrate dehydrogenase-like beta-hydroxyacid dehydrogenase